MYLLNPFRMLAYRALYRLALQVSPRQVREAHYELDELGWHGYLRRQRRRNTHA